MNQPDQALEIVFEAIDEVNEMLAEDRKLDKQPTTVLSGDAGKLDSLGLVSLVVAVEDAVQRRGGPELCLADKIDSPAGPLTTIETLAQYIAEQSPQA